jgi:double-stranded uracil-DNA glycosylase
MSILPDQLGPGLQLVICGTAAGKVSARRRAYYAGPGNRFWNAHVERIATRGIRPPARRRNWAHRSGKSCFGLDNELPQGCFDAAALRRKIEALQPRILAFNGKKAAAEFLDTRTERLAYGKQTEMIGQTLIYVLPSTSGAANKFWCLGVWQSLAEELRTSLILA